MQVAEAAMKIDSATLRTARPATSTATRRTAG
jgi:hypothetical protein